MRVLLLILSVVCFFGVADPSAAKAVGLQQVLQSQAKDIERPSRRKVTSVIEALFSSGAQGIPVFLKRWRDKEVWRRKSDGLFFYGPTARGKIEIIDIESGRSAGFDSSRNLKQIKPNSGVRSVIDSALVQFQLTAADPAVRGAALDTLSRKAEPIHLIPLRQSITSETDPLLSQRKKRLEGLLTIAFGETTKKRVEAIKRFSGDIGLDVRAALNPLLKTKRKVEKEVPSARNIKGILKPGVDLSRSQAWAMVEKRGWVKKIISKEERDAALLANASNGVVGKTGLWTLNTEAARNKAYDDLALAGKVRKRLSAKDQDQILEKFVFFDQYQVSDVALTNAAFEALNVIKRNVFLNQLFDLSLDALSLASIYFLAAIGLAITFGVMGVINMAHGEFIMIGAYTGYVVQQFVPNHTLSILLALPLAFAVTFGAGVLMERTVIRHLRHRPLETLLATFGISIALQQLAKNIFGTQAVPLTAPSWLDGSLVLNDIVGISYIRIAIFVLAGIFFIGLLWTLKKTRLGLEVRAVTQNPSMASSMGINPDHINMLTFGLGSGIAGIAGVAIGLFAQVTSELGTNYIVQSFMTVVVGGVGSVFGTLAGAGMIGSLQKVIEWFNPSNTLAAQTYMIIFVIIFIQFRPRGMITLKGRAAGD
jgi:urea transport system permease protein